MHECEAKKYRTICHRQSIGNMYPGTLCGYPPWRRQRARRQVKRGSITRKKFFLSRVVFFPSPSHSLAAPRRAAITQTDSEF